MDRKSELIYDEIKRSSDRVIDLINSYDRRINYVFIMATTLLGILFLFLSFIINIYSGIDITKSFFIEAIPWIMLGMLLPFIFCIGGLWFTLIPCITAMKSQKIFKVLMPENFIELAEKSFKFENDILEYLMNEINKILEENSKRARFMIFNYNKALDNLKLGIISYIVFSILSFILIFISASTPP